MEESKSEYEEEYFWSIRMENFGCSATNECWFHAGCTSMRKRTKNSLIV